MSINSLFSPNDYHLQCDSLKCNNLEPGAVISTNAIYRLNIDPTSNPDPFINGLIVDSAETASFDFALPFSAQQVDLGLANTIVYDPNNHLSFNGTTIICNKEGDYSIILQLNILSNLITPNNSCVAQLLLNGNNMFSSPPGVSVGSNFISLSTTPVGQIFDHGALVSGSSIVHLNVGDEIDVKFYLAYDTCVLALTSCLCINEL